MARTTHLTRPALLPSAPSDLSSAGKALWKATLAARPADQWSPADCTLLALFVRCALDVQRLDAEIEKHGEVVTAGNGTLLPHPLIGIRARREAVLLSTAKRLRLTPCSRYTAKDVGRLHRHATRATAASGTLEADDLLAAPSRERMQ